MNDIALAKALGYTVYHYDKDVRENQYYCLMDPDFNAVVMWPFQAGERKTETEAWADASKFSTSLDAMHLVEDEIERRGLQERYIQELDRLVTYERDEGWEWFRWGILRATPEQRCLAAFRAIEEPPHAH